MVSPWGTKNGVSSHPLGRKSRFDQGFICIVEMDIDHVADFEWNEEAFANLVLPPAKKMLIQALVEAHAQKRIKFDDFISGKGQGLVIK